MHTVHAYTYMHIHILVFLYDTFVIDAYDSRIYLEYVLRFYE